MMTSRKLDITPPKAREAAQLTVILWLVVVAVITPGNLLAGQVQSVPEFLNIIMGFASSVLLAGLLYAGLRAVAGKPLWLGIAVLALVVTATSTLQMLADFASQYFLHATFENHRLPEDTAQSRLVVTSFYWILCACNVALLWVSSAAHTIKMHEVELARSQAAALQAELNMLRMQLNPHFMSNSLNVIAALIQSGARDEAYRMTDRLSHFLRTSADVEGLETELIDELELIESYCEVERARFGERLDICIDHDAGAERALVPNFILQPLVENAMKYGVQSSAGLVSIRVEARLEGEELLLSVENEAEEGIVRPKAQSGGVGLANVRSRLALLFGNDAMLSTEVLEKGFRAVIRLPYRAEDEAETRRAA
ncbi:histidine kinase [Allosphingosinicella flava]|uniref:Histidine kinase n=1 Tax=Allosphingosinicella flava TaxID=2771430 RepID=A0A7T2GLK6_9SPHN|nr:histidine kinase [Sphingosinicella flava]QPQ56105.1 histidine kinase [Sphingosinicella flava]